MKKTISLIPLIFFLITTSTAQKLIESKTDEFTKTSIKRTDWCAFTKKKGSMRPHRSSFQISKEGDKIIFTLIMMLNNQMYSVKEGDEVMFLMADKSVVSIINMSSTIASMGEGAEKYGGSANLGTRTNYLISEENAKILKESQIVKVRIYTSLGYTEQEDDYDIDRHLKKCLELVTN